MADDDCAVVRVLPPDPLQRLKSLVLDAVSSPLTKRQYEIALDDARRTFARLAFYGGSGMEQPQ